MKKIIKLIPILFLFLACEQGIIFYDIAREIELEEPNVVGNINSIVKLKGSLYTQNGNIYKKNLNTVRGWTQITAPGRVIALASDEENLYALTAKQTDEEGESYLYNVHVLLGGSGSWQDVTRATSTSTIVLFDNGVVGNSDDTVGRIAYVRIGGEVRKLNDTVMEGAIATHSATTSTVAAARGDSNIDYFSNTRAFCSNGTILYSVIDGVLKTSSDTTDWAVPDSATISITDPTLLVYATNKLYAGTKLGLEEITLNAEGKPTGISNLSSNAEATTGEKEITSIGFFDSFDGNAIYTGAIDQNNTKFNGLWGYYPSRGNWNFE